jgi:hypothetical protein
MKYMPWLARVVDGEWKTGISYRADLLISLLRRERHKQFIVWKGWAGDEIK